MEFKKVTKTLDDKIDIGGYSLKALCYGDGTPAIVIEPGLGCDNTEWLDIQKEISKFTKVFSYDRSGLGESDKSPLEKSSLTQVKELHTLLEKSKTAGPYIIIAHSIGGFNARLFADIYPNEVVGIIFVDSSHENQMDSATPDTLEKMRTSFANYEQNLDQLITSCNEVKNIRKDDSLRNIPIIVLTADHKSPTPDKQWIDFQKDIASLSNESKHIIVNDCGHYIHIDKPDVVTDAIKEMLDTTKY